MAIDHTDVTLALRDFRSYDNVSDYVLSISQYGKLIDLQLSINHETGQAKIVRYQELATEYECSHRNEDGTTGTHHYFEEPGEPLPRNHP